MIEGFDNHTDEQVEEQKSHEDGTKDSKYAVVTFSVPDGLHFLSHNINSLPHSIGPSLSGLDGDEGQHGAECGIIHVIRIDPLTTIEQALVASFYSVLLHVVVDFKMASLTMPELA